MNRTELRTLRQLARLHGVQLSYVDMAGQEQAASPEALRAVLKALGAPATHAEEVTESLRRVRLRRWQRCVEPVTVAWDGRLPRIWMRLPERFAQRSTVQLRLEDGTERRLELPQGRGAREAVFRVDREDYIARSIPLPRIPLGYHQLEVTTPGGAFRSLIIAAPTRSYADPDAVRQWGAFLPVYATHSRESWGAGNLGDWQKLAEWIGSLGGGMVASLPLLAALLDRPICEPSPYSPASRLFWNEFYLDIENVPEFAESLEAQKLVRSAKFRRKLDAFRRSREIDYGRQDQLRREVLERFADRFFSSKSPRRTMFEDFLNQRPVVREYARFRAVCESTGRSWHAWPERLRQGRLLPSDCEPRAERYHVFAQWLAQEQMDKLLESCRSRGVRVYLDLPLGVNPDGFDAWRERGVFAVGANAGAPPDAFFSKGQDWGFAPLHPEACREQGYRYVLDTLRFQMKHTGLLRIDHVMSLHRLYWVPHKSEAGQGAYVRYSPDELYALLCLESVRNKTALVGEDLGTVPSQVHAKMKRHGFRGMYVVQFEQQPSAAKPLRPTPSRCVASLNTHDMPTFAAHWTGKDLADRADLDLLTPKQLAAERKRRRQLNSALQEFLKRKRWLGSKKDTDAIMRACLRWLSASSAEMVLINLEDLWLEETPQNVPGTSRERPNWRRKARFAIEEIFDDNGLRSFLETVTRLRQQDGRAPSKRTPDNW